MSVGLFLGAGASVPYNYKTTLEMKEHILKCASRISKSEERILIEKLVNFHTCTDIEYVLDLAIKLEKFYQHVEKHKDNKIIKEFFKQFPIQLQQDDGNSEITEFYEFGSMIKNVREKLEAEIWEQYRWKNECADSVLEIFGGMYKKWGKYDLYIFTTNYDRIIEKYCEQCAITCERGFKMVQRRDNLFTNDFNPTTEKYIRLYKLHGSLDWDKKENGKIICYDNDQRRSDDNNVLINPVLSPKTEEKSYPFNEIIEQFREFMEDPKNDICIVIGFSFRDFKDIFSEFLERNGNLIIISKDGVKQCYDNLKHGKNVVEVSYYDGLHGHALNNCSNNNSIYHYPVNITMKNIDKITSSVKELVESIRTPCGKQECPTCRGNPRRSLRENLRENLRRKQREDLRRKQREDLLRKQREDLLRKQREDLLRSLRRRYY